MKLFFILGNQLFPLKYIDRFKKDHLFFMAEDQDLCTYEKHHKQKILLFLSSMRSYADELYKNKYNLKYFKIEDKEFKESYVTKIKKIISSNKITEISSFEIEDKLFEKKIYNFLKKEKIIWNIIPTPMFLNSRTEFKDYLKKSKKPFMANFYKEVRRKSGILMGADLNPIGGKWSFDEDNRNKLPKDIVVPKFPNISETTHTKKLKPIIEKLFKDHPGSTNNFWFATNYNEVIKLTDFFIKNKLNLFGDYEDAVDQTNNILFHSTLSPYINLGLITPDILIKKILDFHKKEKVRLNSLEGYIRQIIGWREFMRGIYQNFSEEME